MTIKSLTPDHILELGQAFRGAKALLSAVELDVFTLLADGPLELEDLSAQLELNARGARFGKLKQFGFIHLATHGVISHDSMPR